MRWLRATGGVVHQSTPNAPPKIAMAHALRHLESGALVRLVPQWYADAGPISIYYASRALMPAKTRVFVDFIVEAFRRQRLAERFAGSIGSQAPDDVAQQGMLD
jgi:DNA-binding transcriptional LysR family regulator